MEAQSNVESANKPRLLIVGNSESSHIGGHFLSAARAIGIDVTLCDTNAAFQGPWLLTKFNWKLRGHRPNRLRRFSEDVLHACRQFRPTVVLTTGIVPLSRVALAELGTMGCLTANYSTDDPWNPQHVAPWFLETLPLYDYIFSARRVNLEEFRQVCSGTVSYLPFGYNPEFHFIEKPADAQEQAFYACDLLFFGGADADRLPYITALIKAGFNVDLYGGYWHRYAATRPYARGIANMATLRKAISGARVVLGLVRRANRDGHSMRSFEVPAMGGCLLTENTAEHRTLFGAEGQAVLFFESVDEMVAKARQLLSNTAEQKRLSQAAHHLIVEDGDHTYRDRLLTIFDQINTCNKSSYV